MNVFLNVSVQHFAGWIERSNFSKNKLRKEKILRILKYKSYFRKNSNILVNILTCEAANKPP